MLVHRRVIPVPSIKLTGTHLYTCVERGTERVKCLARKYNTIYPAGLAPGALNLELGEHTNHEATANACSTKIKSSP